MKKISQKSKYILLTISILLLGIIGFYSYSNFQTEKKFAVSYELFKNTDSIDIISLQKLAEKHHGKSNYLIGLYYLNKSDTARALVYFQNCENYGEKFYGSSASAICNGEIFHKNWWKENFNKALEIANDGDWYMQWNIANYIVVGGIVDCKDSALAFRLMEQSAKSGYVKAELKLGRWYMDGTGTKLNKVEAFKWVKSAAEKGYSNAQVALGTCYLYGDGVTLSYKDAIKWFFKAKENSDAQFMIFSCYLNGYGVTEDNIEAFKWLELSAKNGNDYAIRMKRIYQLAEEEAELNKRQTRESESRMQSTEVYTCQWCGNRFDGSGYSYKRDGEIVSGDGTDAMVMFYAENLTGEEHQNRHGDYCSKECAYDAWVRN